MKTTATTRKPAAPALPASYLAAKAKTEAATKAARAAVDAKNKAAVDNSPEHVATLHASAKLAQATNASKDALKALNAAKGAKKAAAKAAFTAAEKAESKAHKAHEAAKATEAAAKAKKPSVSARLDASADHYAAKSNAHKAAPVKAAPVKAAPVKAAPAPVLAPLSLVEQAKLKGHFDRLLAAADDEILTLEELAAAVPPTYAHRPGFESPKAFTRLLIGMGFVANPDEPKKPSKKAAKLGEPELERTPRKPVEHAPVVKVPAPKAKRPTPAEVAAANAAARKAALAPKGRR